jgi:hypothetical protein
LRQQAVAEFDAVHRLTEEIPQDTIGLVLTPADVVAFAIAVIGIETGDPLGTDLKTGEGVRMPAKPRATSTTTADRQAVERQSAAFLA